MDAAVNDLRKERIIFCVDLDSSMEEYFYTGDKKNEMRITRTKQLLKRFVEQKASWNNQHEFALMILGENAVWHVDFTREVEVFKMAVDELYAMGSYASFDSTSLFHEVLKRGMLNRDDGYITRVILIYTRSSVLPTKPNAEIMTELHATGKFHFDCIYIHNRSSEVKSSVKPQIIYDRLTELESPQTPGYFFEMTRLFRKYNAAMTQLLANPCQRELQEHVLDFDFMLQKPLSLRQQEEELKRQHQQQQQEDDIQILSSPPKAMRTNSSTAATSSPAFTKTAMASPPTTTSSSIITTATTTHASTSASTATTPASSLVMDTPQNYHRSSSPVVAIQTMDSDSRVALQQQIVIPDDGPTSPKPGPVIRL